jgi:uncharacterized protein with FMN-binding domain
VTTGRVGRRLACLASATSVLVSACAQGKATTVVSGAAPAPAPATTGTAAAGTRTIDGALVSTRYGDIQVAVTLAQGKVTDVEPLTLPNDRPRSAEISQQAGPLLRAESLQAQSGNINILSGATYTSEAWAQSLSAALSVAQ